MNVNYLLKKSYVKLNSVKIYLDDNFDEIKKKTNLELFVSQQFDNSLIISEKDFQLYFESNKLFMWVLIPHNSFFKYNSQKIYLKNITFNKFLKIIYQKKIDWNFQQELTFLNQICIKTSNGLNFIFTFNLESQDGILSKVGCRK